jgi:hypothetical protein
MPNQLQDHDEHLPDDLLSRMFEDDPFDIDAYELVSEGSHPLPQVVIDGAAGVARMAEEERAATMMDTVVAVMFSIPQERHFSSIDAFIWLADLRKISTRDLALFEATHSCSPTQALKAILVGDVFSEREAIVNPASILTVIRTLDEYASDKALWQAWLTLNVDPQEVHDAMTLYKLAGYEPAARVVIVARHLRFDGTKLPTHSALARISRPHDFSVRGKHGHGARQDRFRASDQCPRRGFQARGRHLGHRWQSWRGDQSEPGSQAVYAGRSGVPDCHTLRPGHPRRLRHTHRRAQEALAGVSHGLPDI